MTSAQRKTVRYLVHIAGSGEAHHGDCVGADDDFDAIARDEGFRVVIHPPDNDSKRAFCDGPDTEWRLQKPYLDRNHDIVDETARLIATPKGFSEEIRSGTWATIRYARRVGKPVQIVWPDGSIG